MPDLSKSCILPLRLPCFSALSGLDGLRLLQKRLPRGMALPETETLGALAVPHRKNHHETCPQ
jgi:hypothetical protein